MTGSPSDWAVTVPEAVRFWAEAKPTVANTSNAVRKKLIFSISNVLIIDIE